MWFVSYSTQLKEYRLLDEKTSNVVICRDVIFNGTDFGHKVAEVQQQNSVEFDSNSEGNVRLRDIEHELERVEECRQYSENHRYPSVCFGIDEYADTVMTECLDENQITEPSTIEHALVGYSDADWTRDHDNCHLRTGNVFIMSGRSIGWFSKEQSV